MLFILLNWLVITITCFAAGTVVLYGIERCSGYRVQSLPGYLFAGLIFWTVYAQIWSLFGRVYVESFVCMLVLSGICVACLRKQMGECLCAFLQYVKAHKVQAGIFGFLILVVCYFTSRGAFLYDTGLYHAQCIRWLEEYGCVKGLANIQSRAAYNSSFFCTSALYSMRYIFGQSMHSVQGLLIVWLLGKCMAIGQLFSKERKLALTDFLRLGAIYYMTLTHREIISPSSDFAVMLLLFYILISWMELLESEEASPVPFGLLCVAGVYAVTIKMSAGLILILVLMPAWRLLREKKAGQIMMFLSMGILTVVPFLVRNVRLCGWLLYPFAALDLFDVDWKVPDELVRADSYQIMSWGKGTHDNGKDPYTFSSWMPGWFQDTLSGVEKILVVLNVIAACILLCMLGIAIYKWLKGKNDRALWGRILVLFALAASICFWLSSAPLPRYGYTFLLAFAMLGIGECWLFMGRIIQKDRLLLYGYIALLILLLAWKGLAMGKVACENYLQASYITQQDYDEVWEEGIYPFTENGYTFYYNTSGYHELPGGGLDFEMLGDTIWDGFKFLDRNETIVFGKQVVTQFY